MRTLVIDNYDSYTYNIVALLATVNGTQPAVLRNDDATWAGLDMREFDNIVISPGPGHPGRKRDFGHSRSALARGLPVLGVCLGHQGIGLLAGAEVRCAPQPRHGHVTRVRHDGRDLFEGIPQEFAAVRYHSLCIAEPLPRALVPTAWAEDGVVMAVCHRELPHWGVQFHPESIATEYGVELFENFRRLSGRSRHRAKSLPSPTVQPDPQHRPAPQPATPASARLRVHAVQLPGAVDTESVFAGLHAASRYAFWLDSSQVVDGYSRFSFLGDASGPLSEVLSYRLADGAVAVATTGREPYREEGSIFDVLERRLADRPVDGSEGLPFDLAGGYVGYFGYELKADCGAANRRGAANRHRAQTPDAVWMLADRLIVVDHAQDVTYLVALSTAAAESVRQAGTWLAQAEAVLAVLPPAEPPTPVRGPRWPEGDPERWLVRAHRDYLADVAECQRQLRAGESYEICLTNRLRLPAGPDPLADYRRLRRVNPAPYAAYLHFGELVIACSSPERFLRVDRSRGVESKPIKGTAPRGTEPVEDEELRASLARSAKTRAENLMIVDLLRNDLGRVCETGSVCVPTYLATETYATVHQLVSTVRGALRREVTAVRCAQTCFPGGSMTGAPKHRTMEIIDWLESEARGVYSGALGYFGLGGGADLNIVIRTMVQFGDDVTVGAGGAIVLASDPQEEYEEMILKALAPLRALSTHGSQREPVGERR
ncbi:MAG TPA: aminodeoxychorismate synthase component I [Pseudonocardiaceae bacterium]|nr:aminodeoxychorismate synthase component I [Pseudonocardiaceae bacterium]